MRYMVVIEKGSSSYGAFVPDLPGCIAVGESESEVITLIEEAIQFHLEDLKNIPSNDKSAGKITHSRRTLKRRLP